MWLLTLDSVARDSVLGPRGAEICDWLLRLRAGATNVATADRYGPAGPAVRLFMDSWKEIRWGISEGRAEDLDDSVIGLTSYEQALNPTASGRWRDALLLAGYRSNEPFLVNVWKDAGEIGESVGGHHARFLAAASCGELAQASSRDLHFFLSMMPWIRRGHWPAGWDDERNKLKVF